MLNDIENRIRKVLKEKFPNIPELQEAGLHSDLSDCGINSMSFIKLIVALEAEFGFEFDDEKLEIEKVKTIQDIIDYIKGEMLV